MPKSRRGGRAQSLVEFALVLPLFLLLVFALIDFSRMLFTYISLVNGTREAARAAAISSNPSATVVNAFNNYTLVLGPMQPATDSVQFEIDNAQGASQTSVTCTLPMTPASCTVPARANYSDAYVLEVETTYRFQFTPLFQAVLAGVQYAGFTRAYVNLTSEAKAYIE